MIFCTSHCNHGHRLSDGKPIDHECFIIPPKALEAERSDDFETAIAIIEAKPMKTHGGVNGKRTNS